MRMRGSLLLGRVNCWSGVPRKRRPFFHCMVARKVYLLLIPDLMLWRSIELRLVNLSFSVISALC